MLSDNGRESYSYSYKYNNNSNDDAQRSGSSALQHSTPPYPPALVTMVAFKQVDVFTSKPFKGNPVAVILDASRLSDTQMQSVANWTNLSETTFVVPPVDPHADYRVRIFTPKSELPFAGHPTIGTAHALLEAGLVSAKDGRLVQECGAGLVNLTVSGDSSSISFELPQPKITPLDDAHVDRIEKILGCTVNRRLRPAIVDVGPRWVVVNTTDASAVLATTPDFAALALHDAEKGTSGICLYGETSASSPTDAASDIEVRAFAPSCGVDEDPVCGSGNGSVAAFLRHHDVKPSAVGNDSPLRSSQGAALGRDGHISLHIAPDRILVGGSAVTCVNGDITV